MTAAQIREKYLKFFEKRGHVRIDPAPLVLADDPTTLFTSSGMQPLVPYLLGKVHKNGKLLVNSQPALRTQDIEEVGDNRHTTFFEMVGNWSLGIGEDYKEKQLGWFFDFLTNDTKKDGLGIDPTRLYVSVFKGNKVAPKDGETERIWRSKFLTVAGYFAKIGIQDVTVNDDPEKGIKTSDRIFYYGEKKNWWSRWGVPENMPVGDVGGPDSEVFYDFGEKLGLHEQSEWKNLPCHPNCDCGRFLEIGNSVFIQYKKTEDGLFIELENKNVDFGGGLERITAAFRDDPDVFEIDVFSDLIELMQNGMKTPYQDDKSSYRIIADHIKAATFLAFYGVEPSNKQQGYVMRRLIRRSVVRQRKINDNVIEPNLFTNLVSDVFEKYKEIYFKDANKSKLQGIIFDEVVKFSSTIENGMKEINKTETITGKTAFDLYQSYGFPFEITLEIASERGQKVSKAEFEKEFEKHKEGSRTAGKGVFKGGLADHSPEVVRLHTATHLLQAAMRKVLGDHVFQKGQNITKERSRFDFSHPEKLTPEQLTTIQDLVNQKIDEDLPVHAKLMPRTKAEKIAIGVFGDKYADEVNVYYVGKDLDSAFSAEFCGGPHVTHTGEIGHVRIDKQEKIGSNMLRVYLTLTK